MKIRSLFKQELTVLSVRPEVDDRRFRFEMASGHIVLGSEKVTVSVWLDGSCPCIMLL